jgi:hypothetical protein
MPALPDHSLNSSTKANRRPLLMFYLQQLNFAIMLMAKADPNHCCSETDAEEITKADLRS